MARQEKRKVIMLPTSLHLKKHSSYLGIFISDATKSADNVVAQPQCLLLLHHRQSFRKMDLKYTLTGGGNHQQKGYFSVRSQTKVSLSTLKSGCIQFLQVKP